MFILLALIALLCLLQHRYRGVFGQEQMTNQPATPGTHTTVNSHSNLNVFQSLFANYTSTFLSIDYFADCWRPGSLYFLLWQPLPDGGASHPRSVDVCSGARERGDRSSGPNELCAESAIRSIAHRSRTPLGRTRFRIQNGHLNVRKITNSFNAFFRQNKPPNDKRNDF